MKRERKKSGKKKVNSEKYLQGVLQLGNFIIKKKGDGEYRYIRISTVDGSWGMDFREDTFKYAWILLLASEERYHEALKGWIVVNYHTAMCNPDPEFLDNVIKELYALSDRAAAYAESKRENREKSEEEEAEEEAFLEELSEQGKDG